MNHTVTSTLIIHAILKHKTIQRPRYCYPHLSKSQLLHKHRQTQENEPTKSQIGSSQQQTPTTTWTEWNAVKGGQGGCGAQDTNYNKIKHTPKRLGTGHAEISKVHDQGSSGWAPLLEPVAARGPLANLTAAGPNINPSGRSPISQAHN